jgi:hypothetical protein
MGMARRRHAFRLWLRNSRGEQHGYALPDRDIYDKRATLTDWENILAMFHRQIPPSFGG